MKSLNCIEAAKLSGGGFLRGLCIGGGAGVGIANVIKATLPPPLKVAVILGCLFTV